MGNIHLVHLVNRYKFTKKLLKNHPDSKLLKRKLSEHMTAISEYVSTESFFKCLEAFNL